MSDKSGADELAEMRRDKYVSVSAVVQRAEAMILDLESQLAAKDRRIEELEAKASLKQCAKAAQSERDAERARADKAEADLRDTETLCSRLQARVHLLEQLNAELQASECGQLQERLTAALQDKDVVEAERDEARRELAMRMGRQMTPNGRSCNTSHDDIIPYARKEADREWGRGEGSRLFPEEVDDADQA